MTLALVFMLIEVSSLNLCVKVLFSLSCLELTRVPSKLALVDVSVLARPPVSVSSEQRISNVGFTTNAPFLRVLWRGALGDQAANHKIMEKSS
jgi:hypothetical protein